jgi:hypothetical protein
MASSKKLKNEMDAPTATPVLRQTWSIGRVTLLVLVGGSAIYALAAGVFGITEIVVQAIYGQAVMTVHWAAEGDTGFGFFTTVGVHGSTISGNLESATVGVNNLTGFALTLKAIGDGLGVLAQVALALCAYGIGRALLRGRPFSRDVTRNAIIAAVSLLGFGVASQLVSWWARVVILNEMDSVQFSRNLTFDPAVLTAGLAVALVAVAFRYGERMQRDTEGLV